jgi:hypothetical protein
VATFKKSLSTNYANSPGAVNATTAAKSARVASKAPYNQPAIPSTIAGSTLIVSDVECGWRNEDTFGNWCKCNP